MDNPSFSCGLKIYFEILILASQKQEIVYINVI